MESEIPLAKNYYGGRRMPYESIQPSVYIPLSNIFIDRTRSYLNEKHLFVARFNRIPNFINEIKINCRKANLWFAEYYKLEIKDSHFARIYFGEKQTSEIDDIFYFLYDDLIVYFDTQSSMVRFLYRNTDILKVEAIIREIKKFKERKTINSSEISLLVSTRTGIETKVMKITKPKLSITDNYNDDFKQIHHTILKRLSKKNDKGLVLLHGKPGTGKTSYIRFLISSVKKSVIFLPPNMANAITNPDLISILIDNPNSIFVIEDAENIVVDREKNGNIQVFCSFNTDISKIDNALMRKGRLIAKYEFKELDVPKAQALSMKLGFNTQLDSAMTLTAIYNQEEADFQQGKRVNSMGFKA